MKTSRVLLKTVHGSHLYGMAHAGSDLDTYMVVDGSRRRARQTINGAEDLLVIPLPAFSRQVHDGVPQALEALFSPVAECDGLEGFRAQFRPGMAAVLKTFARTSRGMALNGTSKSRRHGVRLAHQAREFYQARRFNPRLTPSLVAEFTEVANSDPASYVKYLLALSPVDPFDGAGNARNEYMDRLYSTWG